MCVMVCVCMFVSSPCSWEPKSKEINNIVKTSSVFNVWWDEAKTRESGR